MILADTSIWVAHFRLANPALQRLLAVDEVLCHPLVVLEIACGTPPSPREQTLHDLRMLRQATVATMDETLALIKNRKLHGSGCGATDIALLAATLMTSGTLLWTLDKKLMALATRFEVAYQPPM